MRRKETSLLVESWRRFINEGFDLNTDREFLLSKKDEIRSLDTSTMLKVSSRIETFYQLNEYEGQYKSTVGNKGNKYRIDFLIFKFLAEFIFDKTNNKLLMNLVNNTNSFTFTPKDMLVHMINFNNSELIEKDFEKKIKELSKELEEGEKLIDEFKKYKKLIEDFNENKDLK